MRVALAGEFGYVLRFLLVGILNTLVGLGSIYGCKFFLGLDDVPANMIGYLIGLTNSFIWNRRWTFSHSGGIASSLPKFVVVFLFAYAANLAVALALIRQGAFSSYVAHAVATIPYTVIFYLGSRYFVFPART
jgi:putative flippase GtrA